MKNLLKIMSIALSVFLLAACGGGKSDSLADSTGTGMADSYTDSVHADTLPVSEADSAHSYRNDRGTDSVSAGAYKGVPRNP